MEFFYFIQWTRADTAGHRGGPFSARWTLQLNPLEITFNFLGKRKVKFKQTRWTLLFKPVAVGP